MATATTITSLSLEITTFRPDTNDSRERVDLLLGYYSTYGGVPVWDTICLHKAGNYIGDSLDATLGTDKLPDDVGVIFALDLQLGGTVWKMDQVKHVNTVDSTGATAQLVSGLHLGASNISQTIYSHNQPDAGVYGMVHTASTPASKLIDTKTGQPVTLLPGQQVTISIDPGQQWTIGGQIPCNCNGPLIPFSEPYMNEKPWVNTFSFTRGAVVAGSCAWDGQELTYGQWFSVGNYTKMSVLTSGALYIRVWDNNYANMEGKFGVKVQVETVNYGEQATAWPPAGIAQLNVRPQDHSFTSGSNKLIDTQVDFAIGDVIHVRSNPADNWTLNQSAGLQTNADGYFAPTSGQTNPGNIRLDNWFFDRGCLLGTLDDGASYFGVGTSLDMTCHQAGRLKLVVFDDSPSDDSGSIKVCTYKSKAPYLPPGAAGSGPHPNKPQPGQLAVTLNGVADRHVRDQSITLTNNGGPTDLKGLSVVVVGSIPRANSVFTFADSTPLARGASVTVYAHDSSKTYNLNSPADIFSPAAHEFKVFVIVAADAIGYQAHQKGA